MTIKSYTVRSIVRNVVTGKATATAGYCLAQLHGYRRSFEEWLKLVEVCRTGEEVSA
jgi:hypothetical protein